MHSAVFQRLLHAARLWGLTMAIKPSRKPFALRDNGALSEAWLMLILCILLSSKLFIILILYGATPHYLPEIFLLHWKTHCTKLWSEKMTKLMSKTIKMCCFFKTDLATLFIVASRRYTEWSSTDRINMISDLRTRSRKNYTIILPKTSD